jgi:D-alanine-D-alanine ligase
MTERRIHVVVLCGGRSAEHDVSLVSTRSILNHLDQRRYRVSVMGLDRQGGSYDPQVLRRKLELSPDGPWELPTGTDHWLAVLACLPPPLPVVFPVLHGPFGEDGTVQGAMEMLGLPYVGAGVLASSLAMNKVYCKQVLAQAGLPVLPFVSTTKAEWGEAPDQVLARIENELAYPVFVKPANMGSSIGVGKSSNSGELRQHLEEALRYDLLVLAEQGVDAREIEVSVLGNEYPRASIAGEIVPSGEFYDYAAKYLDGISQLLVPAPLSEEQMDEARRLALETYRTLGVEGMARVDFLLDKNSLRLWVNEANTIPGFTQISMYPKLWQASGLSYPDLIEELINLGLERHRARQGLSVEFSMNGRSPRRGDSCGRPPRSEQ